MNRRIIGFHQDDAQDWVARLDCGHNQHVRHDPPWQNRPWVVTHGGHDEKIGEALNCVKCDRGEPKDPRF